ncbi:signal recognition particle subunit srp72 [Acrodontium crateriforme]|uniref:Signal recognition particle subunit SRP72 n=1 Tax=Acrodontium crateriforme TaxID=150365 RepID=A0AAQ3RBV8_9PEZI|nr:signal recognition particle subunit srp72 [Acrodontium crateriforme]
MASSIPALASLLKKSDIEDHDEILKSANHAIKQSKNDLEAQHVKIVSLLNLDRFQDAVHAFETGGDKLKEKASLEYSYALYKTGKSELAAEIAAKGSSRGFQHVEAQARYRTEDFKRSAELYKILGANYENDAEADLKINMGAVDAQLEWNGLGDLVQKKKPAREDLEAFETAYNAACGSIARGEMAQGEILLKRARDLCNALEDLTDEEKVAELLPITVQQIYVLGRQGKTAEADKLAHTIDLSSIPDASTRYIAQVNQAAALEETVNPYLTQRLVTKDVQSLKPDYPFNFQTAILNRNRYATELQALKFDGTAESTATAIKSKPSPNLDAFYNSLSVVNAVATAKGQKGKDALKLIVPLLEKRPKDVGLVLTIVQLYILHGNSNEATATLQKFADGLEKSGDAEALNVRFAPGIVGTLVSLYHNDGRTGHVRLEMSKAASYWRQRSKSKSSGVNGLLKAAGSVLLGSQDSEDHKLAQEIFQELYAQDEGDRYAAAGLSASSKSSSSSALTPIDRLVAKIDIDELENAGIAQLPSSTSATVTTRKRSAEETKPKKTKKMRPRRMPKDYDENKKPDPERWLPLRDRSTYRPKGKKNKARQAMLAQGAAPATDSEGSRPATPGGDVVKGKQSGSAASKNKKKSKGKR